MSSLNQGAVRWRFVDVHGTGPAPHEYTFHINPDEGGSPTIDKQLTVHTNVGPHLGGIIQEGRMEPSVIQFGGVILTQEHYEALEIWSTRRLLLDLHDDLGRRFRGVFTNFTPERERRAYRYWFHRFSASFAVWAYVNASGQRVYGWTD